MAYKINWQKYIKDGIDAITIALGARQLQVTQNVVGRVQLDKSVRFIFTVIDTDSGDIPAANITVPTNSLKIYKNGVLTVTATPSKADGEVYYDYSFPSPTWALEDVYRVQINGVTCIMIPAVTAYVAKQTWGGLISDEPDIVSKVDAIKLKTDVYLDATVSSRATQTSVNDIPAEANSKDFNGTQKTYLAALIGGLSAVRKTTYATVSGSGIAVAYPNDGTWATIKTVTVSKDTLLRGIIITNSGGFPTNPVYRITYNGTADLNKVYPYGTSTAVESGIFREIRDNSTVAEPDTYYIQTACDIGGAGGASATLTELDIIELG